MNITIILTTTVTVQNKSEIYQTNKQDRINTYLKSIRQWLSKTNFNIVVVENSGYYFEELKEELELYSGRFEIITFNESELPETNHLINNPSKGVSESYSIYIAHLKSSIIPKSLFIIKVTGRYFVPGFEEYLSIVDILSYDALTLCNQNKCEIIGTNVKYFYNVFDINLKNANGEFDGHVENIYKYRMSLIPNVFRCKQLNIEPTQQGGFNIMINSL